MPLNLIHVSQIYFVNSMYTGKKPSKAKVDQLVNTTEKHTLANHICWGLWGLISVSLTFPFYSKEVNYLLVSANYANTTLKRILMDLLHVIAELC